jgi:hypothetical protein
MDWNDGTNLDSVFTLIVTLDSRHRADTKIALAVFSLPDS